MDNVFKILVVGDPKTGKSKLIQTFLDSRDEDAEGEEKSSFVH